MLDTPTIQALNVNTGTIYVDSMVQYLILILSYALLLRIGIVKRKILQHYMNSINWMFIFLFLYTGGNMILLLLGLSSVTQYTPIRWIQVVIEELKIITLWITIRILEHRYKVLKNIPTTPYKSDTIVRTIIPKSPLFK